ESSRGTSSEGSASSVDSRRSSASATLRIIGGMAGLAGREKRAALYHRGLEKPGSCDGGRGSAGPDSAGLEDVGQGLESIENPAELRDVGDAQFQVEDRQAVLG